MFLVYNFEKKIIATNNGKQCRFEMCKTLANYLNQNYIKNAYQTIQLSPSNATLH